MMFWLCLMNLFKMMVPTLIHILHPSPSESPILIKLRGVIRIQRLVFNVDGVIALLDVVAVESWDVQEQSQRIAEGHHRAFVHQLLMNEDVIEDSNINHLLFLNKLFF